MTKLKYKTVETVIKEKADAEELRQLRNLKRNLESGIVFNLTSKEMAELKRNDGTEELGQLRNFKRNIESGIVFDINITPELMEILMTAKIEDL